MMIETTLVDRAASSTCRRATTPGFDAAAARALLEAARESVTGDAEQATGFYWGDAALRVHVEAIRKQAARDGDERLEQLATRFLE